MSAATEEAPHVSMSDLKKFPRPVAKVVAEAVNKHGVRVRFMDDSVHLRLYNGDRNVYPCKVAAVRPAEHTMKYLVPWLEQHVPSWPTREVSKNDLETLAEVLTSEPKVERKVEPPQVPEPEEPAKPIRPSSRNKVAGEWRPWKHGLETNGVDYRCAVEGCDYYREGTAQGVHLHQGKHTGEGKKWASRGGKANTLKNQQAALMRREAVRVLAEAVGLTLAEDATDTKQVEKLEAEVEELRKKNADLQARVDLLNEAFRGLE